ncbi:RNA polymerase III subunit C82 [Rhizopus stolonifer]|uniref:DNA-directed RNA polymerase III subunit RPC3 n=1 Tax=Rhizopus stolonifer TaxID=4846 RepID=A0A367J3V4_RHIST|nr:RNA polymerase III subunit C82 [Rhizopus stolonifer]
MSSESRLCKEIILEHFGPIVSGVSQQLLLKGRLTLPDIIRFSKLTTREVKESLVVLVQHGIVFFSEAPEGKIEPTYYSIDPLKIMYRLNLGRIIQIVKEHHGKEAEMICTLLFVNELEKYKRSFTQLVTQKYITAVLPEHSRSVMDRLLDATEKEKEKYTIMTAKDIANAKISAEAHIDALYGSNEIIGMKRKAFDPIDEQRKRAALMELGEDMQVDEAEVDENIFFTINYDAFNIMFRNNSIIDLATERINRSAGQVVKAFFDYGKDNIRTIKEADSRKYIK